MKKLLLLIAFLLPLFSIGQVDKWVIEKTWEAYKPYSRIVSDDGGKYSDTYDGVRLTKSYMAMAEGQGIADSIKFAWMGVSASATTPNGTYSYLDQLTKAYSFYGANHATQTTSTRQPFVSGDIAPNEHEGMKNVNGGTRFMTHPTISFADGEAWSVTMTINNEGNSDFLEIIAGEFGTATGFYINYDLGNSTRFYNGSSYLLGTSQKDKYGKNTVYTFVHSGTVLTQYINGVFNGQVTATSNINFNSFLVVFTGRIFNGTISAHIIRSIAPTAAQVKAEADLLLSIYPPIPSVTITDEAGNNPITVATTNTDVVATPMGSVIANVTEGVNVEKVTNGTFTGNATGWELQTGWTYNVDNIINDGSSNYFYQSSILTVGKWYKITMDLAITSGYVQLASAFWETATNINVNGANIVYAKALHTNAYFRSISFDGTVDNVSVEEVGWAGSQGLYDGIYAQTAGTVAEKTLAASKVASMWCYYNNDMTIGSVYNKLYNWFAVSLIQQDIDLYNAANPAAHWGWHVPTSTEFTTLQTNLGGEAVAGGKMKKEGLNYWADPNEGATNISGFTALSGGLRINTIGQWKGNTARFFGIDASITIDWDKSSLLIEAPSKTYGQSLRMIKD